MAVSSIDKRAEIDNSPRYCMSATITTRIGKQQAALVTAVEIHRMWPKKSLFEPSDVVLSHLLNQMTYQIGNTYKRMHLCVPF
jgi:hypothetical protein